MIVKTQLFVSCIGIKTKQTQQITTSYFHSATATKLVEQIEVKTSKN